MTNEFKFSTPSKHLYRLVKTCENIDNAKNVFNFNLTPKELLRFVLLTIPNLVTCDNLFSTITKDAHIFNRIRMSMKY
jgi:hypothetical protein